MPYLLLLIPAVLAILRLTTRKYPFSALTTLACAALIAVYGRAPAIGLVAAALAVSAAGDWFLAHHRGRETFYALGVGGFLVGHALLIAFAAHRAAPSPMALVAGGLLLALYAAYLTQIVLPGMPKMLRLPAVLYTLVSIAGFTVALTSGDAVYASAIALLLFSDTMIAAADFAGRKELSFLILPTYYLCHILIALSAMLG